MNKQEEDMTLPQGKTCGDCVHFLRCQAIVCQQETSEVCDWYPIRFVEKKTPKRPTIVCLCGSTRWPDAFRKAQFQETLAGKIVLTIGCYMESDTDLFKQCKLHSPTETELQLIRKNLEELHLRKIDLADEILVLNVAGYIGEHTHDEIQYALAHGKRVRYWEVDYFGVPLDYNPDGCR